MRLIDLKPRWVNLPGAADGVRFYIGLSFLCPTDEQRATAREIAKTIRELE